MFGSDRQARTQPLRGEKESRRRDWTAGRPVRLADGSEWSLPRISASFLATRGAIIDGLVATLDLAGSVDPATFQDHITRLAILLLLANYDLPDHAVSARLDFDRHDDEVRLLRVVLESIADEKPLWIHFYLMTPLAGPYGLLIN